MRVFWHILSSKRSKHIEGLTQFYSIMAMHSFKLANSSNMPASGKKMATQDDVLG